MSDAFKHNIAALICKSLIDSGSSNCLDKYFFDKIYKQSLYEITSQECSILSFSNVLKKIADSNIPVIALKGLVLRNLYPDPSLRSMSDYDICIRPIDIDKTIQIIQNEGYKTTCDIDKHIICQHPIYKCVELHSSLLSEKYSKKCSEFEERAWSKSLPINLFGISVLSLNPTYQLIYLVLHMATHIKRSGFGLRQLCDWVLFIEKYKLEIDWNEFRDYIRLMGLKVFTDVLFKASYQLFCLETPQAWYIDADVSQDIVERFILDVFESGVFGKEDNDRITANRILHYTGGSESKTSHQKIKAILTLLFPAAEKMDVRYEYAKKHKILLPFAYLHRFAYSVFRSDISFSEKLTIFRPKKASEIFTNRSLLLRQLGLID